MSNEEIFKVSIVGRPNVGKSTLFNRLVGERLSVVAKEAGTTRDRVWDKVVWNQKEFMLYDTAGLILDFYGYTDNEVERKAQGKIDDSISESDLILFVTDSKDGVTPEDEEVARRVRKTGKQVIMIVNKADSEKQEEAAESLKDLGFKEKIVVSAKAGRRMWQVLDAIAAKIKEEKVTDKHEYQRIAIIGRPNVGKSTIFNLLVEGDVSIVSTISGTTRDSIREIHEIKCGDQSRTVEFIDTAGIRRRGKVEVGIEKFSVFRALDSIERSDLVLVVVEAKEGFTRPDIHLIQYAIDSGKKMFIVINKIDLLEYKSAEEVPNLYRQKFIHNIRKIAISAKNRENIGLLKKEILANLSTSEDN